jgi:hypothetical protein
MKKIFKDLFIPLFVSVLFGFVSARLVYSVYGDDVENKLRSSKIYLVENGEYSSYDVMREENSGKNYIYYVDEDGYKTVVGITRNENNIEKIKRLYSDSVSVHEYYVSTELLNDKQTEYDAILNDTEDIYEVREVVDNILNLYKDDDSIRLVFVN